MECVFDRLVSKERLMNQFCPLLHHFDIGGGGGGGGGLRVS